MNKGNVYNDNLNAANKAYMEELIKLYGGSHDSPPKQRSVGEPNSPLRKAYERKILCESQLRAWVYSPQTYAERENS